MNLRCKEGDVAIITWDFTDCLDNLGRMVEVAGPLDVEDGVPKWLIRPVTPELYSLRELDGSRVREHVTWSSRIAHPDAWMKPIRPEDLAPENQIENQAATQSNP